MNENKKYDLEERTFQFAKKVQEYVRALDKTTSNIEYGKQLIRSSGSVAANYIEANESESQKDYYHRVKICKKEDKESRLWLRLTIPKKEYEAMRFELIQETDELMKIFGTILVNSRVLEK